MVGVPVEPEERVAAPLSHRRSTAPSAQWLLPATLLRWIVAAIFVGAGSAKLLGFPSMVALFNAVGVGQWLRYVTGIGELTGAFLLARPRTVLPATFLLSVLMVGAAGTEMLVLRRLPLKSAATLLAVLIVAISSLRRPPAQQ